MSSALQNAEAFELDHQELQRSRREGQQALAQIDRWIPYVTAARRVALILRLQLNEASD